MTMTDTKKPGPHVDTFGLRLNLGCGSQIAGGWVNVDKECGPGIFCLDVTKPERWEWDDGEVDGIVIHHVLSHFTRDEMMLVLEQCARVLKPDAWLRVSDADVLRGVEAAIAGDVGFFVEKKHRDDGMRVDHVDVERTIGYFITQGGWRKQLLYPLEFAAACAQAGFSSAYTGRFRAPRGPDWLADLDTRAAESWFAEAQK